MLQKKTKKKKDAAKRRRLHVSPPYQLGLCVCAERHSCQLDFFYNLDRRQGEQAFSNMEKIVPINYNLNPPPQIG